MIRTKASTTAFCTFFIVIFFTALILLPSLMQPTEFSMPQPADPLPPQLDLSASLPVIKYDSGVNSLKGSKVKLAELFQNHSTIILNFWATWCPPCLEELPSLEYLQRQLSSLPGKEKPLLVTVSVDERPADVERLFETLDFKPSFIVLHDAQGRFSAWLGTTRFPETYWIDSSGKVLHKWIGPQEWLSERVLTQIRLPASP